MLRGLLTAVVLWTGGALAQAPADEHSAADVTLARQLGNQGLELARNGDCAGAIDPLSRSEALHHAPTTLTVLGECHIALGKLVQAAEELTRVVRESLDAQAPAAYRTAQDQARARLDEVRPRIPRLRLAVHGAPLDALSVRIDGQAIPTASLGVERPVDPGQHRVEVSAHGYNTASGEVMLREGEAQSLNLELLPLPPSEVSPPETSLSQTPSQGSPAGSTARVPTPRSHAPAIISFGIAAVGVAAGSVFGVATLSKTSSLDRQCPTRSTCPASTQSEIDTAKTTALASTISFGMGAAGLLTGLYFAVRSSGPEPTAASVRDGGVHLRPSIGLGSIAFDASF
jgi:hypothetical protein